MRLTRLAAVLILAVSGSACVAGSVRNTAKLTAQSVDNVKAKVASYQKALEADAKGRIDALARQKAEIAEAQASLDVQIAAWELAESKQALRLYRGVWKAAEEIASAQKRLRDIEARERGLLRATQAKFANQNAGLSSLSKQLNQIAETPSWKNQAKFYAKYLKAIAKEVKKLQKDSEASN